MSDIRLSVFVPRTCVVGKFERKRGGGRTFMDARPVAGGIVSCRFKNERWVKQSVFERLTGYKPGYSRDAETQLKKTVLDVVGEFQNVPVAGFRVVGWNENIYKFVSNSYDICGDVVIEDPRGFAFGIPVNSFFAMLSENRCDIIGGKLAGEFAYGWTVSEESEPELTLVMAGERYENAKALSERFYEKKAGKTVTDRQLEYGHVYRSKKLGGDFVYLGIRDTYSEACHKAAFETGSYDAAQFAEKEKSYSRQSFFKQFPTSTGKRVFYSLYRSSKQMPYFVRASANGTFESEVGWPADIPGMYNDEDTPATLANIEKDMKTSPCFNRISLCGDAKFERMPFDVFELIFGLLRQRNTLQSRKKVITFPFESTYNVTSVRAEDGRWLKVTAYDVYRNSYRNEWLIQDLSPVPAQKSKPWPWPLGRDGERHMATTCREIYDKYRPMSYVLEYENGERVPAKFAAFLLPIEVIELAKGR